MRIYLAIINTLILLALAYLCAFCTFGLRFQVEEGVRLGINRWQIDQSRVAKEVQEMLQKKPAE